MRPSAAIVTLCLTVGLLAGCAATGQPEEAPTAAPTDPADPAATEPAPTRPGATCETVLTGAEYASLDADGFTLTELTPLGPVMERMIAEGGLGCHWGRSSGDVRVWFAQQEMDAATWAAERTSLVERGYVETGNPFPGTLEAPADFDPNFVPAVHHQDGTMYFASYSGFLPSVRALHETPTSDGTCDERHLAISLESRPHASGAGQFFWDIVFTNTGDSSCTLTGTPESVALVNAGGEHSYGEPSPATGPAGPVSLAPNGRAYSLLHLTQAGASTCELFSDDELMITPPHGASAIAVPTPNEIDGCAGRDVSIMDYAAVEAGPHLL